MRNNLNNRPQNGLQKAIKYFTLAMTMVYPAIGVYILFSTEEQLPLKSSLKIGLGLILIVYGIFRFIRNYKNSTPENNRHDPE